jgi:hypothetical protein
VRPGVWSEPRESGAGTPQPSAEPQRRHVKLFPRGDKVSATHLEVATTSDETVGLARPGPSRPNQGDDPKHD